MESLQRAIRARLAVRHGADSPFLLLPLRIVPVPVQDDGVNWHLALDGDDATQETVGAVHAAAGEVAHSFNLERLAQPG